jgi:electron transport complex protein RnfB
MKAVVDQSVCVGCTLCVQVCPSEALIVDREGVCNVLSCCTGCATCAETCPVKAITMQRGDKQSDE